MHKYIYYICIIVMAASVPLYAQKELSIGVHTGVMVTSILNQNSWGAQEYAYTFEPKQDIGIDILFRTDNKQGIKTGVWLWQLGQTYSSNLNGTKWYRKLSFEHINIPFVYNRVYGVRRWHANFGVGLIYSRRVNAKQIWTKNGAAISEAQDFEEWQQPYWLSKPDVDDRYVRNDFLLYGELGIEKYMSANWKINVLVFGSWGIIDINSRKWRYMNRVRKEYAASHNAILGVKIELSYIVLYKARYFFPNH